MQTQYISRQSTPFYDNDQGNSREFVLIYGDTVDTTGFSTSQRTQVKYRGRTGWVKSSYLMSCHPLEIYIIDAGQGDAAFIVTPNGRKILIDGGKGSEAFQFLVWKYRLDNYALPPLDIDLMVVTHADEDHIGGLVSIIEHERINIKKIVHSGIAKFSSGFSTELGDIVTHNGGDYLITRHNGIDELDRDKLNSVMTRWYDAVKNEANLNFGAVDSSMGTINVCDPDIQIHVLGPRLVNIPGQPNPVFPCWNSSSETVNGHSVVLRLDYKNVRILFPGDINKEGADYLMKDPAFLPELDAHVLKAPHHGSHHYTRKFLKAVNPQVCVISSGEDPDHGHPRANFLGAAGHTARSNMPLIFSTELIANFAVDKDAEASDADMDADPVHPSMIGQARRRFKKRINGLINVRTDGDYIYCARRVAASYQFVTYRLAVSPRN
jgi:competence protein ComEC